MSKVKNWTKLIKIDPVPILVEKGPAYVKYAAATRFLPQETRLIEQIEQELIIYKPRERLLATQQGDGLWKLNEKYKIEEHAKAMQFLLQLKNMYGLMNYGCTNNMPAVQKGLIALLKMQKPDGKFPLLFHHSGLALWILVQFGLAGNPFVERGFRWISKRQREDGGWLSASIVPANLSLKNSMSGIWTSLVVLQAFTSHSRLKSSPTCTAAAEFLLKNYLLPNSTDLFPEPEAWNYLYIDYTDNGLFRGGTLRFVEVLAPLPEMYQRSEFKKAVEWLIDQQMPSGLFPAVAGVSKQGDFEVTLRVMNVLKEIEKATV